AKPRRTGRYDSPLRVAATRFQRVSPARASGKAHQEVRCRDLAAVQQWRAGPGVRERRKTMMSSEAYPRTSPIDVSLVDTNAGEVPADRPHFASWPRRLPRTVTPPETSLWHNLEVAATRYPAKAAT